MTPTVEERTEVRGRRKAPAAEDPIPRAKARAEMIQGVYQGPREVRP